MNPIKLSPSILAADFSRLGEEMNTIRDAGCEMAHIDVMDGLFVPNISIGVPVVKSLRRVSDLCFDVHLMIENPLVYVQAFAEAGADILTFHYESKSDPEKVVEAIHRAGKKAGVAIKPKTDVRVLDSLLDRIDMVLVMTVEPGFGGQSFMADMCPKICYLREKCPDLRIEVDGGIDGKTAAAVREAGADVLVAGTYFFKASDRKTAAALLRG